MTAQPKRTPRWKRICDISPTPARGPNEILTTGPPERVKRVPSGKRPSREGIARKRRLCIHLDVSADSGSDSEDQSTDGATFRKKKRNITKMGTKNADREQPVYPSRADSMGPLVLGPNSLY